MKAFQLLFTSLLVTIAQANPGTFLGLFVRFNEAWRPVASVYDTSSRDIVYMRMAESYYIPTHITNQGDHFSTRRGFVGFHKGHLSHGKGVKQGHLKLNAESKVGNQQFYVCGGSPYPYNTMIMINRSDPSCVPVDIYLKAYNESSGQMLENSHVPIVLD